MTLRLVDPPAEETAAPDPPNAGAAESLRGLRPIETKVRELQPWSKRVDDTTVEQLAEIRRLIHDPAEEALEELWVGITLDVGRVVPNLRQLASIGRLAESAYLRLEGR